jgi:hypothetical protein
MWVSVVKSCQEVRREIVKDPNRPLVKETVTTRAFEVETITNNSFADKPIEIQTFTAGQFREQHVRRFAKADEIWIAKDTLKDCKRTFSNCAETVLFDMCELMGFSLDSLTCWYAK